MSDLKALAETMKGFSDTAGDHHWQAGEALEIRSANNRRQDRVVALGQIDGRIRELEQGVVSLAGVRDMLQAQLAMLCHAIDKNLGVTDFADGTIARRYPNWAADALEATQAQSIAHIEAAALRRLAERTRFSKPRTYAYSCHAWAGLMDDEADQIEAAAQEKNDG